MQLSAKEWMQLNYVRSPFRPVQIAQLARPMEKDAGSFARYIADPSLPAHPIRLHWEHVPTYADLF